jgi:hypothetical protein
MVWWGIRRSVHANAPPYNRLDFALQGSPAPFEETPGVASAREQLGLEGRQPDRTRPQTTPAEGGLRSPTLRMIAKVTQLEQFPLRGGGLEQIAALLSEPGAGVS